MSSHSPSPFLVQKHGLGVYCCGRQIIFVEGAAIVMPHKEKRGGGLGDINLDPS